MNIEIKKQITVVAFPVDTYEMNELSKKTDSELSEMALADSNCGIWSNLDAFQIALNADIVDTDNNWVFFLDSTTY